MSELTIKLSKNAKNTLEELAKTSGKPINYLVEQAIETYRRHLFLVEANLAFSNLRKEANAWQEELQERELWDLTLLDGVDE